MMKKTTCKNCAPKKLRVGFIGTGNISSSHIAAYAMMPETEIVAGCDIKPERLEWFKKQPGCQNAAVYADYNMMLKAEKLDIVDVCTPNGVHAPASIAALKAGCHVMVEKPMAMNPAECQAMNDAAAKAGKLLACGFQIRYTPAVQMCKRAIEEGLLGDIMYVKVHAMRRRGIPNWGVFGQKELQGGGPMIDIGVHQIESAHYVMGEPKPVAASGRTWTFLGNKPSKVVSMWPNWDYKTYTVEDLCVGQVRFENGTLMQIESAFCCHQEEDTAYWEIMGTKGGFNSKTGTLYHDLAGTMVNSTAGYLPGHPSPTDFVSKLRDFTSAILTGTPLHSSGEEGMAVQKIIDGLYRSADKGGKEVKI
ncbi:MAG: Gfo/Idh/MocA family oxidoreductase [Lentisphaeria bacterium]|nr:Gfo/Idh/MocA family oxidoreductase [Lentisphaeria bacterium]